MFQYSKPVDTWFQAGWNAVIVKPKMLPPRLASWDLYEYLAGFAAATHKRNLPSHWLQQELYYDNKTMGRNGL